MRKEVQNQKPAPQKPRFEVAIFANRTEYKGAGETFEDALNSIAPPEKFVTTTILRVTKDGKVTERFVRPPQMWKLFHANPNIKEIVLKQFKILFDI